MSYPHRAAVSAAVAAPGTERAQRGLPATRGLRIVFLTNLYPPCAIGGYEQICHGVAHGLMQRGHDVTVVTSDYRASEAHDVAGRVHRVLRLESGFAPVALGRRVCHAMQRPQLEWHNAPMLRRLLRQIQPDISLCWNAAKLGGAVLSALEEYGPVAYYLSDGWMAPVLAHQGSASRPPLARLRRCYKMALSLAGLPDAAVRTDRLMFCSQALVRQYARAGAAVDQPTVVYHGVAPELFPFRPQHILQRQQDEPLRLLYVGQITPQKGVLTLLTALRRLRERASGDSVTLTLVGPRTDTEFESQLREQIAFQGLGSVVTWLPAQPRETLPALYGSHDILVFPSEWEEPFSVTLLEAMATGIPVVVSLRGGSAEIVRHQQNAVVFEAGDASDLATMLAWTATHPEQAAILGTRASNDVHNGFCLDAEVRAIEDYLGGVLCPR